MDRTKSRLNDRLIYTNQQQRGLYFYCVILKPNHLKVQDSELYLLCQFKEKNEVE
ncbi:hypothetical protein [Vibrio penaeicida]|uniref:hypothetical protein n=1 Tax=Vibrio penaeicida TaxID=104609 RepID=UPI001CC7CD86|nr:hypothetical protein [Vibrio penaeicida]